MARVKLSAILVGITGRYGGSVFRPWKGLTVLSALQTQVHNPNTVLQAMYRAVLAAVTRAWSALSVAKKQDWGTVADYLTNLWDTQENPVGYTGPITTPRGPFTPLGACLAVHSLLHTIAAWDPGDVLKSPPLSSVAPVAPTVLAASGDNAGVILTWADPSDWGGTTGKVRIWARTEDGKCYPQLIATAAAAAETYTITGLRGAGAAGEVITLAELVSGDLFIGIDAVNGEGLRSAPSNVVQFKFAAP
jgi:hypothetical protein